MKALLFFVPLFVASLQASTPSSPEYEAGVVEFYYERDPNISPTARLAKNLALYTQIIGDAPQSLDIIVFPEMTLNQVPTAVEIPEPDEKISPCDSDNNPEGNLLKTISCSARVYELYVSVDIVTKVACPDNDMTANNDPRSCTDREDRMSYYNTNVVFDRNGTLISRYRKFNLFGEDVDRPFKPTMITFETDFGVKFGHFICFDLLFQYPSMELVRNQSVTDIIFPTMWYSELPFLTGVQIQHGWAYANNVNLLAAGANNPSVGSTGTGIFAGRKGSLISVMEGTDKTTLYVATVPKRGLGDNINILENSYKRSRTEMAPLSLMRDQLKDYNVQFLGTPTTPATSTLCHNGHCCTFNYSFTTTGNQTTSYRYAAAVFHGKRTYDSENVIAGVFVCAVLACQTTDVATCGLRNEALNFNHQWHNLEITGTFPSGDQFLYLPSTLDTSIMPFHVNEFDYEQMVSSPMNNYNITMKSVGAIRDFYTFGIYGRDFSLDGSGAGVLKISCTLIISALLAIHVQLLW